MWSTAVPCHEDVDKALVSVEFRGDVVFDPLVDGLWRGIYFDLLQQLLLQFHEWEQKAETFPLKNLQHSVFVLVAFYERMEQRKKIPISTNKRLTFGKEHMVRTGLHIPGSIFSMLTLLCWNRSPSHSRSFSLTSCCRQSRNSGKCAPFSSGWAKSVMLTRSTMMARAANCAR